MRVLPYRCSSWAVNAVAALIATRCIQVSLVFAAAIGAAALLPVGAQSAIALAPCAASNAADATVPVAAFSIVGVQVLSRLAVHAHPSASLSVQALRQVNSEKCAVTAQRKIAKDGERYCPCQRQAQRPAHGQRARSPSGRPQGCAANVSV